MAFRIRVFALAVMLVGAAMPSSNAQVGGTPIAHIEINGIVVDHAGQPIVGALVRFGGDQFAGKQEMTTDRAGRFAFPNCQPGKWIVTAHAGGYSPDLKEMTVGEQNAPLEFKLAAGHRLKLRVVNADGQPIANATCAIATWRGYRALDDRLTSDADGRLTWNSAPDDAVLCDILHKDYLQIRNRPLRAGSDEIVVTMPPKLEISGVVVDAATGMAIPNFQIRIGQRFPGQHDVYWRGDDARTFTNGLYSVVFSEPADGYAVQVVAPDYRPASSRVFTTDEHSPTFTFKLQPSNGPTGIVLLPSGKPAQDAEVVLSTSQQRVILENGRFSRFQRALPIAKADENGIFQLLPTDDDSYRILVLHDDGFAEVTRAEFEKANGITLQAWGRIEGRSMLGAKPDVNRKIEFRPTFARREGLRAMDYRYSTHTDQEGQFSIDRVMPGAGSVMRIVSIQENQQMWMEVPSASTAVDVKPGDTAKVTIGGTGRPLVGQVKPDHEPDTPIEWTRNSPIEIGKRAQRFGESPARYVAPLDATGHFTIPDVPAGDYQLRLSVEGPKNGNASGERIGWIEKDVNIPEIAGGRSDEPLDLGVVTAKMSPTLNRGDVSPEFVAQKFSGGAIRLSEFDGKLVLVHFWTTYSPENIAGLRELDALHKQFAADPRFVMISLNCNEDSKPAKDLVAASHYDWLQTHAGKERFCRAAMDYLVVTFPSTFLIGPDGRVLSRGLSGDKLKDAVATALADEQLFHAPRAQRPLRYPITRFPVDDSTIPVGPKQADADSKPAAVLFANSRLELLDSSGKAIWSVEGLATGSQFYHNHGIAVDSQRQRIYVSQPLRDPFILAFNFRGQKLWRVDNLRTTPLVDPKTGNVWSSGGSLLNVGETIVLDPDGNELATYPHCPLDLTYDSHDDAFWVAGYQVVKLSRDGKVLFQKAAEGWCFPSVWVNPSDGSAWVPEAGDGEGHIGRRQNGRSWLFNADGSVRQTWDAPDDQQWCEVFNQQTGDAWVSNRKGLCRVRPDGKMDDALPIQALALSIDQATGEIWITTKDALLKLDSNGKTIFERPFEKSVMYAWVEAVN